MNRRPWFARWQAWPLLWLLAGAAHGALAPPLPASAATPGVIHVYAYAPLGAVLRRWQVVYEQQHAGQHIEIALGGSDVAMAHLYTGKADIALLGREATASELKAFEWIYQRPPHRTEIATGSFDRPGYSPALVVFVHRDNPLRQISLSQLDAIIGTERLAGAPAPIQRWGELGLRGEWADRLIHIHGFDLDSGSGRFFQHAVLRDSRKLRWETFREYTDSGSPGAATHDAARWILKALSADRYGIAIASLGTDNTQVRPLALLPRAGTEAVSATRATVMSRCYPLARDVNAYSNDASTPEIAAQVRAFLDYVLSTAGQSELQRSGGFLPLQRSCGS